MATLKEKTARGLFWGALNSGTMQVLNIVIGVFLARLLSPADYALVGILAVFAAVGASIQESGFTAALVNQRDVSHRHYNAVFWFSNLVGAGLYALLFFCAPLIARFFHQPELVSLSRFLFLCIPLSALGTVPQAWLFKNLVVRETTLVRVVALVASGTVGIWLAWSGRAYWSLAWQQIVYVTMTSLGKYLLVPWRPSLRVDFSPIREMLGFSVKMMLTNIVGNLNQNILTFVFGRLFPLASVGHFSQAYKWNFMAYSFISSTVNQVSQPVFVEISGDAVRQAMVLRKLIRFAAFLSFPLMLGLASVSEEFVLLLIGGQWLPSVPLLQLLCVSGAFMPLCLVYQNLLVSHGRSGLYLWGSVMQIVSLLLLVMLFHRLGIGPMVAIYSAANIAWLGVWHLMDSRMTPLRLSDLLLDLSPYLLFAAVSVAVAWWVGLMAHPLWLRLAVRVAVAAALYVAMLYVAGARMLRESVGFLKSLKA